MDTTMDLPEGGSMPRLGFGTGGLKGDTAREAVRAALDAGYRRFDTAEGYGNEGAVGDALADADREDVFITSKALPKHLDYESLIESCERSLERLGVEYLDCYQLHWPNPAISVRETMAAMAKLKREGKVRHVGVSNVTPYTLICIQHVSEVPVAVNQIEFHPWRQQRDTVAYCESEGVAVDAAAPLARTEVFGDEAIADIARERGKTEAQVVLRWALERGVAVAPGSASPEHIRGNAGVFGWELREDERERIDALERGESVYNLSPLDWENDAFGIAR